MSARGSRLAVASAGRPLTSSVTPPANPRCGSTLPCQQVRLPAVTVAREDREAIVKSASAVLTTARPASASVLSTRSSFDPALPSAKAKLLAGGGSTPAAGRTEGGYD